MKGRHKNLQIILVIILVSVISIHVFNVLPVETYFEGNVRQFSLQQLALVQVGSNMDCDAFNQISVTYDDNQKVVLANGRQGLTPFIDDSISLDLTNAGKDIKITHFEVALECDGNAMDGSTVVSGFIEYRICGDPSYAGTTCMLGEETPFSQFDSLSIGNVALQDSVLKVIHSVDFTEAELDVFFNTGTGSIFFKHESFPILNFNFIHPTAGAFSGSYNSVTENQKIVAQYGSIQNTFSEPPSEPVEENKALVINFWSPQILDESIGENTVTIGLGIENLEVSEPDPTIKVANLNGIVVEEFDVSLECSTTTIGLNNCETTINLNLPLYAIGSYQIILSSESRAGISASVPLEIVDQSSSESLMVIPGTQFFQDTTDEIFEFITGTQTTTTTGGGVSITRSVQNFDFGADDILIILLLVGITGGVALFAKYRSKIK